MAATKEIFMYHVGSSGGYEKDSLKKEHWTETWGMADV